MDINGKGIIASKCTLRRYSVMTFCDCSLSLIMDGKVMCFE